MLCSQARSQPACFSGRTSHCLPSSAGQAHLTQTVLRRVIKMLATAQQGGPKEEAEALRISAADLRAKLSSFDSKSFLSKPSSPGKNKGEHAPVQALAVSPMTRDISSKVQRSTRHSASSAPIQLPSPEALLLAFYGFCQQRAPSHALGQDHTNWYILSLVNSINAARSTGQKPSEARLRVGS